MCEVENIMADSLTAIFTVIKKKKMISLNLLRVTKGAKCHFPLGSRTKVIVTWRKNGC